MPASLSSLVRPVALIRQSVALIGLVGQSVTPSGQSVALIGLVGQSVALSGQSVPLSWLLHVSGPGPRHAVNLILSITG